MTYEVIVSDQASADLRGIYEYIAFELKSPQYALGQLKRLEKGISSLYMMPNRHPTFEREPWRSRRLRTLPVDRFVVLYIADETQRTVTVVRVMYGGRDIDKHLPD